MRNQFANLLLAFVLLTGCAVGPNYTPPQRLLRSGLPAPTPDQSAPRASTWWQDISDPALRSIIAKSLENSSDVAITQARLQRALATAAEHRANRFPELSASVLAAEVSLPSGTPLSNGGNDGRQNTAFYNSGFTASWEVDLFGARRRQAEASAAEAEATIFTLADVQVATIASVAATYAEFRAIQKRMALAASLVQLRQDAVLLERGRVTAGTAIDVALDQKLTELENESANLSSLVAERGIALDALSLLVGVGSTELEPELQGSDVFLPHPPDIVDVADPRSLIQQRPDIRTAERSLAAASARIGVAVAQRFPSVSFFGLLGIGGPAPADMIDAGSFASILLPRINWTFLDFGRSRARISQAEASYAEAEASYEKTVLGALVDANQALAKFGVSREQLRIGKIALERAIQAEDREKQRKARGSGSRSRVISFRIQRAMLEMDLVAKEEALAKAYFNVQKSLGLGWVSAQQTDADR